jgi:hypothetical protein
VPKFCLLEAEAPMGSDLRLRVVLSFIMMVLPMVLSRKGEVKDTKSGRSFLS